MQGIKQFSWAVAFSFCISADANAHDFRLFNPADSKVPGQIDEAVKIVNGIIRRDDLLLAHIRDGEAARENSIPVYTVARRDAEMTVARVPRGCRCIVIGGNEFEEALEAMTEAKALSVDDAVTMLTFLLLHELGHVANEHYGQFLPDASEAVLNTDQTLSKEREAEADQFVGDILRGHREAFYSDDPDAFAESLIATPVILLISSLSFSVSTLASLDCLGCRVLGSKEIFWDHSRSHPNFEYRLLKLNHAISPDLGYDAMVEDYERARGAAGSATILYEGERIPVEEGSEEYRVFEDLIRSLQDAEDQN